MNRIPTTNSTTTYQYMHDQIFLRFFFALMLGIFQCHANVCLYVKKKKRVESYVFMFMVSCMCVWFKIARGFSGPAFSVRGMRIDGLHAQRALFLTVAAWYSMQKCLWLRAPYCVILFIDVCLSEVIFIRNSLFTLTKFI